MNWLILGFIIAGLKFPFNWIWPDAKFADIQKDGDFGLFKGDRLKDAWSRLESTERPGHDLTNLAVEWNREWLPLSTKFYGALFAYSQIFWILVVLGILFI